MQIGADVAQVPRKVPSSQQGQGNQQVLVKHPARSPSLGHLWFGASLPSSTSCQLRSRGCETPMGCGGRSPAQDGTRQPHSDTYCFTLHIGTRALGCLWLTRELRSADTQRFFG